MLITEIIVVHKNVHSTTVARVSADSHDRGVTVTSTGGAMRCSIQAGRSLPLLLLLLRQSVREEGRAKELRKGKGGKRGCESCIEAVPSSFPLNFCPQLRSTQGSFGKETSIGSDLAVKDTPQQVHCLHRTSGAAAFDAEHLDLSYCSWFPPIKNSAAFRTFLFIASQ